MKDKLYIDDPVVASFFIGELGWLVQRWQGYLRYLQDAVYPDHKFIIFMNTSFYPIVNDFVNFTVSLPKEWSSLNLETDCYEAPPAESPPGSLTPPNVYAALIEYCRTFYNVEKAVEMWPPRGYSTWVDKKPQKFARYSSDQIQKSKDIICVLPRARTRAPHRNVPEHVWRETVDFLKQNFTVVLGGTPGGACLADYKDPNVINLISYAEDDKLEKLMQYMCNAACTISSQSGPTHVGLLCNSPSLIIGHERTRHAITDNRFKAPVSFRYVADYRAIDAQTIVSDLFAFFDAIRNKHKEHNKDIPVENVLENDTKLMKELVGGNNE